MIDFYSVAGSELDRQSYCWIILPESDVSLRALLLLLEEEIAIVVITTARPGDA